MSQLMSFLKIFFAILLALVVFFGVKALLPPSDSDYYSRVDYTFEDPICNVAGIDLHGDLVTYPSAFADEESLDIAGAVSEDILYLIQTADYLDNIDAILIDIDSLGGIPVAADEVEDALKAVQKPTVALIRESGISGAYWAATGADWIIASDISQIGGIGITSSYVDYAKENRNEGITYNDLRFGKFKDLGDPDKSLTEQERAIILRDLEIVYEKFIDTVAGNRNLEVEEVRDLADGSIMLGVMAKEKGLIDDIGSYTEALDHLAFVLNTDDIELCW